MIWRNFDNHALLRHSLWSVVAEALGRGLFLLAMLLLAHLLSADAWGQFGLIRTTIMALGTAGGLSLGVTANRYVARFKDTDKPFCGALVASTYGISIVAGSLVALALFLFSGQIATSQLGRAEITGALQVTSVLILMNSLNGAQVGVLQGMNAYSKLAVTQALQGVIGLAAFVIGAYCGAFDGAIAGYVVYSLAGLIILSIAIRQEMIAAGITVQLRQTSRIFPIFLKFSVPIALMGVAVAPFKWLAESLLAQRASFAALGTFYAAMLVCTAFVTLASTLHAPLVSFAAGDSRDESPRVKYLTLYGTWYAFAAAAIPFILCCDFVSRIAFGAKYASPDFLISLILLVIYGGLMVYYQGIMRLVMQRDSMWLTLGTNLAEGIAVLVGAYALVDGGATGLAWAYVASYGFRIVVTLPLLIRYRIATPNLLLDRYFLVSLALVVGAGALKIGFIR